MVRFREKLWGNLLFPIVLKIQSAPENFRSMKAYYKITASEYNFLFISILSLKYLKFNYFTIKN